jgi:hypothetical protein
MKDILQLLIHCRSIWMLDLHMDKLYGRSSRSLVYSTRSSVFTVDSRVMIEHVAESRNTGAVGDTVKVL